jgi:hypothetical protein
MSYEFNESGGDLARLLRGVADWKGMLDKVNPFDGPVGAEIGIDLNECQGAMQGKNVARAQRNVPTLIWEDMNAYFNRSLALDRWKKKQESAMYKCFNDANSVVS